MIEVGPIMTLFRLVRSTVNLVFREFSFLATCLLALSLALIPKKLLFDTKTKLDMQSRGFEGPAF